MAYQLPGQAKTILNFETLRPHPLGFHPATSRCQPSVSLSMLSTFVKLLGLRREGSTKKHVVGTAGSGPATAPRRSCCIGRHRWTQARVTGLPLQHLCCAEAGAS